MLRVMESPRTVRHGTGVLLCDDLVLLENRIARLIISSTPPEEDSPSY